MKKILLLFAVLFTITASAQIPTSDILASYTFTNRDVTTDDVNLAPLTQIGALQFTNDRFENTQRNYFKWKPFKKK